MRKELSGSFRQVNHVANTRFEAGLGRRTRNTQSMLRESSMWITCRIASGPSFLTYLFKCSWLFRHHLSANTRAAEASLVATAFPQAPALPSTFW